MSAKDIRVAPIAPKDAHAFVRTHHYSGKSVNNSQLHIGAFIGPRLVGVAQFGPPMDRSKLIGLVRDTPWNGMLELNRLALIDATPKNTESRFLSVCFRLIRKHAPHVQWIVSFADGTQCGDGTIYRAAGFVLTGIKKNTQIWQMPDGEVVAETSFMDGANGGGELKRKYGKPEGMPRNQWLRSMGGETVARLTATDTRRPARGELLARVTVTKGSHTGQSSGSASMAPFIAAGARPLPGFQLRYVYFLDPTARARLTVPVLPFSEIDRRGAGMYRGQTRARSIESDAPGDQPGEGGAIPTRALQPSGDDA